MSYIPLLHTAVNAMKVEYIHTLPSFEEDKSRFDSQRHIFKNKIMGDFRAAIENCHHVATQEKDLDKFAKELLEAWKDLVQFIFLPPKDVRSNPIPVEIADWATSDLLERMRGKSKTSYEHFVRSRGLVFQGVIDEVRSTIGGLVPFGQAVKRMTTSRKQHQAPSPSESESHGDNKKTHQDESQVPQTDEEKVKNEVKTTLSKKRIPSVFSFSTFGSTSSLDSHQTAATATVVSENATEKPNRRQGGGRHHSNNKSSKTAEQGDDNEKHNNDGDKLEPKYKAIIRSAREENARIAQIVYAIFTPNGETNISSPTEGDEHGANNSNAVVSISLHALFEICKSHGAFVKLRDPTQNDDRARLQFSRRVFNIVHRGLVPGCHLAVDDSTVYNMLAVAANSQVDPSTNRDEKANGSPAQGNPVTTGPDGAITLAAPTIVANDKFYDQYFGILVHLLYANFHIKPNKAKGIVPEIPYSGHNICCVAVNKEGKIVGLDFNQCKQDQNLCSHAEKRLSEALNEKLKSTVAPNTPPSLEDYTFISSLEPCHMCANFISRMGVKKIGFLMKDPMQCDALNIAASLLGLTIVRPAGTAFVSEALENTFKHSEFPEEEITSWLGDVDCKKLLGELKDKLPILEGSECDKFMKNCSQRYPGVVVMSSNTNNNQENNDQKHPHKKNTSKSNKNDDDGEDLEDFGMVFATSSILAGMDVDDDGSVYDEISTPSHNSRGGNDDDEEEEASD